MAEHLGSPGVAFRNPFPKEGCREPEWTCGPPEGPMSDEVAVMVKASDVSSRGQVGSHTSRAVSPRGQGEELLGLRDQ